MYVNHASQHRAGVGGDVDKLSRPVVADAVALGRLDVHRQHDVVVDELQDQIVDDDVDVVDDPVDESLQVAGGDVGGVGGRGGGCGGAGRVAVTSVPVQRQHALDGVDRDDHWLVPETRPRYV